MRLVLASASPRRRELLAQAGYPFTVEAADIDESRRDSEAPAAYVQRLAEQKATAVLARHAGSILEEPVLVLGADTCVVCDGEILGKPTGPDDARRMLLLLSGRTHTVLTGVAITTQSRTLSHIESTIVTFDDIPEADLALYCATAEPLDKAGAYGIQGYAARWVPRVEGCYFNVMGLPIARTVRLIEAALSQPGQAGL
jgi:septum formation protein